MERFLIVFFQGVIADDMVEFMIRIVKLFNARVSIMSPIDKQLISRIASNSGIKEEAVEERLINETYLNLYNLEERFKKDAVDVVISARQMSLPDGLIAEIKKEHPEMLFLAGDCDISIIETLKDSLALPIVIFPAGEK
jgi:hypothetical protein